MIELHKNKEVNQIYEIFSNEFYQDEFLKTHRYHIENNGLGFGERPFHVLWRELVNYMPEKFRFIEIGVYKAQVLSLVKSLANKTNKDVEFIGVTPLDDTGDKYSQYGKENYSEIITKLFHDLNLEFDINKNIIKGLSNDSEIMEKIKSLGKFDLIYIDGGHDYNSVVSDINLLPDLAKSGSLVVFDDSSYFKGLIQNNHRFSGHYEVSLAIKNFLEFNSEYEELICVGHNRVFQKK